MSQSHTQKLEDPKSERVVTIYHQDFSAIIEKNDGSEELIMIEVQKANNPDDIFRFKKYISKNFQKSKEKEIIHPQTNAVEKIKKPIRLVPIFILNFRIENEINDLLIHIKREKIGVFKNKCLTSKNEFIDNLSFDMIVIQIPNIERINKADYQNNKYKTKLYQLLNIFNQARKSKETTHKLLYLKNESPKFLERIIKRLRSALYENPELEENMETEDTYLRQLIKKNNMIDFFENKYIETSNKLEKKSEELEKKSKELNLAAHNLEKKQKLRQEQKKEIELEKNQIKENMLNIAKIFKQQNKSIREIKQLTNLTEEEISKL